MLHLVVDGANVVGSVPDGWWRDRAGAATRLAERIVAAGPEALAAMLGGAPGLRVHLVLEGAARLADVPERPWLDVVRAAADGDAAIVALVGSLAGGDRVRVVTADRGLRERVVAAGAEVTGPGTLLEALPTT